MSMPGTLALGCGLCEAWLHEAVPMTLWSLTQLSLGRVGGSWEDVGLTCVLRMPS